MGRRRAASTALGALASAGVGSLALWYQLFRRPLPRTDGSERVVGLEAEVAIERDRFGAVRIRARSVHDLCFAQGFAMGQDRLWQLELYRRVGAGRTAEFAGAEGIETDRLMRVFGFRRIAEREAGELTGDAREFLDAYAAGVNAAVEAAPALPLELQLLRIDPEPFSAADSLTVGKLIALGFSTNMETELLRADLIRRVGADKAARLEPVYPAGNPVVTAPGVGWDGDPAALLEQLVEVREALGMSLHPAGSNNWVVSGERSLTGKPLLAGDPHISTTMPDVWYTVELECPGIDLRGGAMPGFPGVMIGQSRRVAWSFTNVMGDVQDLFVERVRGGDNGHAPEYEFEGDWLPLTVHREEIAVRGRSEPEVVEVRETHHGPIVNEPLRAEGEPLALAWTALRHPFFSPATLRAGGVADGHELLETMRNFAVPCMNGLWADSEGNIGYKLIGKLPLRRGGTPDLPKPGWTGEFEWDGYVPFDELPEVVNPDGGVLVTANNRIEPPGYAHHITSDYLDGYRAARIEQLLAERERHSLDDFARIQSDVYTIPGEQIAHRLARLRPEGQREQRAIERLKSWDHRLTPETVAGTIQQAFSVHFARVVSEAAIGHDHDAERWRSKSLLGFTAVNAAPWRFLARLIELWDEGDSELVGGASWDELALRALSEALDDLERRFGSDPAGWRWGDVHGLLFPHALGQGSSRVSKALDRLLSRRVRAGGAQETVNSTGYVPHAHDYRGIWAASYRLLADLGDPDRSRWQHMTGQSGQPGSPHYDDLLDPWLAGRSNPVAQPPAATLELRPAS